MTKMHDLYLYFAKQKPQQLCQSNYTSQIRLLKMEKFITPRHYAPVQ